MDKERNFEKKKGWKKRKNNIPKKNSMALLGQHTLAIVVYCFAG